MPRPGLPKFFLPDDRRPHRHRITDPGLGPRFVPSPNARALTRIVRRLTVDLGAPSLLACRKRECLAQLIVISGSPRPACGERGGGEGSDKRSPSLRETRHPSPPEDGGRGECVLRPGRDFLAPSPRLRGEGPGVRGPRLEGRASHPARPPLSPTTVEAGAFDCRLAPLSPAPLAGRPGSADRENSEIPPGPRARASPQSTTSVSPNGPRRMFSGFKSRWTTPRLWAYSTARQDCASRLISDRSVASPLLDPSCEGIPCSSVIASRRLRPRTSRMAKNGRPLSSRPRP